MPVCAGPADALALQQRLIEVFEQNKNAVIRVKAAYRGPDEGGKAQVMLRVGTGFFISKEGHVLVRTHAICLDLLVNPVPLLVMLSFF